MIFIKTENIILSNLYYSNIMEKSNMGNFKTKNNDFNIELKRDNVKSYFSNNDILSFKYLCKFTFKNILNINLYELILSENDIFILLDNLNNFIFSNMNNISIPIKSYNNNYIPISIYLFKDNMNNYIFKIIENKYLERINILFDKDSLLEFIDLIYFIFVIDIDEYNYNHQFDDEIYNYINYDNIDI